MCYNNTYPYQYSTVSDNSLCYINNIVIIDNLKTATTFNNRFLTKFTQENLDRIPNPVKMFQGSSEEELNNITFEESSICTKLKNLNVSKSPGTDQISPVVLNRCAEDLAEPLTALFTKSFQSGQVQQDWLAANVIPIYKKKDTIPCQETTDQFALPHKYAR